MGRIYNFAAGPAMLPEEVLRQAADEMLDYNGTGMSVMEMSHRSKVYDEIIQNAKALFHRVMHIPENYKVLFLQGGASTQFAMVPLNLLAKNGRADYALTGSFSSKAYKEATNFGKPVRVAASTKEENYSRIPRQDELDLDPQADYLHYCMNNTVYGTTWQYIPETGNVPLVCDMSSCILSEPVDVSKFSIIYAGAQKNIGPAGLTVVIIRNDMLYGPLPGTPVMLNYAEMAKNDSMYNTPPTYSIYINMLVLQWIEKNGGLAAMQQRNREKAKLLYDYLDTTDFYKSMVQPQDRSLMNVTFTTGNEEMDAKFVKASVADGMTNLKGHRVVGAMRASIYNAMPIDGVRHLVEFMKEFEKANG